MIRLIFPHGVFAGLVPGPGRFAGEIVLPDQRLLNRMRPLRIDFLLSAGGRLLSAGLLISRIISRIISRRNLARSRLRSSLAGQHTSGQRERARRSQPSTPDFRAPILFQLQALSLCTPQKTNPTEAGILIILRSRRQCQFPLGLGSGYGSVPARKTVPSCRVDPRGRTRNTTSCPLFRLDSTLANSSSLFTACLFTSRTTSPRFRLMSSANDPVFTSCTITPLPADMSRRSAISGVSLRTVTPNLLCLGVLSSLPLSSSFKRAANSLARSAMVTVVSCCLLLRRKPNTTFAPGLREAMSATNSAPLVTFFPSTVVMVSPTFSPAWSAGLPATTLETVTPDPLPYTRAMAGFSTASNIMPIDPRETLCSGPVSWL